MEAYYMTQRLTLLSILALAAGVAGCATVSVTPAASKVVVATATPSGCKSLGQVFGQGGGYWTVGEFVPNGKLVESAIADARNKAAELGATHIVPAPVQITGESTTATVSAAAYACP
jgi:hypothetical protein